MKFKITLTTADFYRFLSEHSYTRRTQAILRYTSIFALAGALAVMLLLNQKRGSTLLALAVLFAVWAPLTFWFRAMKLEGNNPDKSLEYALDATGMTVAPPAGKPRRLSWNSLEGVSCTAKQIVIYKDLGHAYILPRGQLPDAAAVEQLLQKNLKTL